MCLVQEYAWRRRLFIISCLHFGFGGFCSILSNDPICLLLHDSFQHIVQKSFKEKSGCIFLGLAITLFSVSFKVNYHKAWFTLFGFIFSDWSVRSLLIVLVAISALVSMIKLKKREVKVIAYTSIFVIFFFGPLMFYYIPFVNKGVWKCDYAFDKNECLAALAMERGDAAICENIKDNQYNKDICVAGVTHDLSICSNISYDYERNKCISATAKTV